MGVLGKSRSKEEPMRRLAICFAVGLGVLLGVSALQPASAHDYRDDSHCWWDHHHRYCNHMMGGYYHHHMMGGGYYHHHQHMMDDSY
jgi:hypothetical protein